MKESAVSISMSSVTVALGRIGPWGRSYGRFGALFGLKKIPLIDICCGIRECSHSNRNCILLLKHSSSHCPHVHPHFRLFTYSSLVPSGISIPIARFTKTSSIKSSSLYPSHVCSSVSENSRSEHICSLAFSRGVKKMSFRRFMRSG
jgi:hypothetical protein